MWSLAYLFTFALVVLPIFVYLKSQEGKWVIDSLEEAVKKSPGILLFLVPIAVIMVVLLIVIVGVALGLFLGAG